MLPIVNTDEWRLHFRVSQGQKQFDPAAADTQFCFATGLDVLKHLSNSWGMDGARFQGRIQQRLTADPNLRLWKHLRTPLKRAKNFDQYRKGQHPKYNKAAMAFCAHTSGADLQRCHYLLREINESWITVPRGQIVFHGGTFDRSATVLQITKFLSASLDPSVGCWHAKTSPKGVALAINVDLPLSALWASTPKLREFELLFACGLILRVDSVHHGTEFDVMETTLVDQLTVQHVSRDPPRHLC
jgi:hypothetical protein